ncbi:hypothetical protein ABIC84_002398 [Mucilaginibacter sp. 3215]
MFFLIRRKFKSTGLSDITKGLIMRQLFLMFIICYIIISDKSDALHMFSPEDIHHITRKAHGTTLNSFL